MILLLSSCALLTLSSTKRSHPTLDGTHQVHALDDTVRIHRDGHGIPHIVAKSELDAWYFSDQDVADHVEHTLVIGP